jgi:uncharacterized protein DUF5947
MPNDHSNGNHEIGNRQSPIANAESPIGNVESPFAVLRRFVSQRAPVERCELCSAELHSEHEHLVDLESRQMTCACQPCAILFSGKANPRYRRVPREIRYLPDFRLTEAQWESLLLPIGLAFFFRSTPAGKVVALYPSPAGATESLLDLESWDEIERENPVVAEMESDTEALLVNRVRGAQDHFLVPIDECYRLVGLIRTHWHGLSGGAEMWDVIEKFFAELKEKAVGNHAEASATAAHRQSI